LFILLTGLALVVPGIIVPTFSKIFVDDILLENRQDWIGPVLLSMLLVLAIQWTVNWLQNNQLTKLETRLAVKDSSSLIWHVLHLPVIFFTQRYPGDLVSRLSVSDRLAQLLSRDLATNFLNILVAVFYIAIMLQYSVVLTLVAIFTVALNLLAVVLLARSRTDENRRLQTELGKLSGTAMNGLSMIDSLKASGSEDDFFARWAGYQAKVVNASQVLGRASQVLLITPGTLTTINTVAILVIGGELVILGHLTAGDLVAFQLLTSAFIAPVNALVAVNSQLQEVHGDLMRVDDVHNYELDPLFTHHVPTTDPDKSADSGGLSITRPAPDSKLSGNIEITNLCFGYNPLEAPLISDFNLTLTPGKRVALVGGSGSGKSTLARLIAGLYQPWSGTI
ncbi:MAG: ATP-binding cassette domain-containing protein, partial [Oceanicoccus sp.]|uniref:ABC transporter transmembrane domain-containing protein n=1 Tax=Oceanicoccus sp. TaxID=2691044 RepID=UPI00260B44F3